MDDKALATIVRDLEAQAVVYIANLGKIGTPNVHLWRRELGRSVRRQPRAAPIRDRVEMKPQIGRCR
jgi:hypothetical protein